MKVKIDENFIDEYELDKDQYFLKMKLRQKWNDKEWTHSPDEGKPKLGIMSKTNKNGTIPKIFDDFGDELDIYILDEYYRDGWKFYDARKTGQGDGITWVALIHPEGFTVEIRASDLLDLLMELKIENGVILNKCFYDAKAKELLVEDQ